MQANITVTVKLSLLLLPSASQNFGTESWSYKTVIKLYAVIKELCLFVFIQIFFLLSELKHHNKIHVFSIWFNLGRQGRPFIWSTLVEVLGILHTVHGFKCLIHVYSYIVYCPKIVCSWDSCWAKLSGVNLMFSFSECIDNFIFIIHLVVRLEIS